jgi:DNA-binding NarL/FixJ family response regulator
MLPIKIAISENHLFIRQGLVTTLKNQTDFKIIFETAQEQSLLDELKRQQADIVFLGIQTPFTESVSTLKKIKNKCPNTKVIILSPPFNNNNITDFLSEGISGLLLNTCDTRTLVEAVYKVNKKEKYYDPSITEFLLSKMDSNETIDSLSKKISDRQVEIIKLLYEEKSSDEIADILFLSRRTIEWHKNKIFEKVGCKSAVGAIKFAINNGIINA